MAVQVSQPYDESYAYKMDLVIPRLLCMGMLRCHVEMLTLMHLICLTTATQKTLHEQSQTLTVRVTAVYSIYEQAANDVTYRGISTMYPCLGLLEGLQKEEGCRKLADLDLGNC